MHFECNLLGTKELKEHQREICNQELTKDKNFSVKVEAIKSLSCLLFSLRNFFPQLATIPLTLVGFQPDAFLRSIDTYKAILRFSLFCKSSAIVRKKMIPNGIKG